MRHSLSQEREIPSHSFNQGLRPSTVSSSTIPPRRDSIGYLNKALPAPPRRYNRDSAHRTENTMSFRVLTSRPRRFTLSEQDAAVGEAGSLPNTVKLASHHRVSRPPAHEPRPTYSTQSSFTRPEMRQGSLSSVSSSSAYSQDDLDHIISAYAQLETHPPQEIPPKSLSRPRASYGTASSEEAASERSSPRPATGMSDFQPHMVRPLTLREDKRKTSGSLVSPGAVVRDEYDDLFPKHIFGGNKRTRTFNLEDTEKTPTIWPTVLHSIPPAHTLLLQPLERPVSRFSDHSSEADERGESLLSQARQSVISQVRAITSSTVFRIPSRPSMIFQDRAAETSSIHDSTSSDTSSKRKRSLKSSFPFRGPVHKRPHLSSTAGESTSSTVIYTHDRTYEGPDTPYPNDWRDQIRRPSFSPTAAIHRGGRQIWDKMKNVGSQAAEKTGLRSNDEKRRDAFRKRIKVLGPGELDLHDGTKSARPLTPARGKVDLWL